MNQVAVSVTEYLPLNMAGTLYQLLQINFIFSESRTRFALGLLHFCVEV